MLIQLEPSMQFNFGKSSVTTHQHSVSMEKEYPCEECDCQTAHKRNLTTHQKSVHMANIYPCDECDYQATKKINLTVHQYIRSQSTWVINIHVMDVITRLHVKALS